jgi:hypothetical protein
VPYSNGIGMGCKYDRDRLRRLACGLYPRRSWRKDQINFLLDQPSCSRRQLVNRISPFEVNQQVFAFNITERM